MGRRLIDFRDSATNQFFVRIPGDPKVDIAQKVKSLSSETKLLRNMKKPSASETKTSDSICRPEEKCLQSEPVEEHVSDAFFLQFNF